MGTLYVVATPIGNLGDITLRALDVLKAVGLIAAEDTRTTRKLLARFGVATPLTSYSAPDATRKLPLLLQTLAEKDVALVSEAGTPGISDPGCELVAASAEHGFPVTTVPGPSAVTAALAVAGFPAQRFLFLGFPPSRAVERRRFLVSVAQQPFTLVLLEAPHRVYATLQELANTLGNRRLTVCRELTKLHEEVFRGTVQEAVQRFSHPRGEFTLVVEGAPRISEALATEGEAAALLGRLRQQGLGARDAVAEAARATGMRRRELYRLWLKGQPCQP